MKCSAWGKGWILPLKYSEKDIPVERINIEAIKQPESVLQPDEDCRHHTQGTQMVRSAPISLYICLVVPWWSE